jgi:purine-binding chemotaxis protein CheW
MADMLPATRGDLTSLASADRSFYSFREDGRLYAIEVNALREVSPPIPITPVAHAPAAIRGLANLRSRILLVLNLRSLLQLPSVPCTEESRLMILKPTVLEDAALMVDRGGEIVRMADEEIEWLSDADSTNRGESRLIIGVCKLEKELMMIVDASRLATSVAELMK